MKWSIDTTGQFYDCGETAVVYFDTSSGDTHLISDFAAHLIHVISMEPISTEAIINRVSGDIEDEDLSSTLQSIPTLLEELASMDIIERT